MYKMYYYSMVLVQWDIQSFSPNLINPHNSVYWCPPTKIQIYKKFNFNLLFHFIVLFSSFLIIIIIFFFFSFSLSSSFSFFFVLVVWGGKGSVVGNNKHHISLTSLHNEENEEEDAGDGDDGERLHYILSCRGNCIVS